jgi:hypothetical protein
MSLGPIKTIALLLPKTLHRIGINPPRGAKILNIYMGQTVQFKPKGVEGAQVYLKAWVMEINDHDAKRQEVTIAYQGAFTHLVSLDASPPRIQFRHTTP